MYIWTREGEDKREHDRGGRGGREDEVRIGGREGGREGEGGEEEGKEMGGGKFSPPHGHF